MNNNHKQPEHEIDPVLHSQLKTLRPVPERDPEAVRRGRARFTLEVDQLLAHSAAAAPSPKSIGARLMEAVGIFSRKNRFAAALVMAALVVVFLLSGTGLTAAAAQSALPGDALYGVKTGLEETRIRLSGTAATQSQMYLEFAQRRLDEISRLIEQGRYDDIRTAAADFQAYIQKSLDALAVTAMQDPARATELAGLVTQTLVRYAGLLNGLVAAVPETVKSEVQSALHTTQTGVRVNTHPGEIEFRGLVQAIAPAEWIVAGQTVAITTTTQIKGVIVVGDMVKVHAYTALDGRLTAREIELESDNEIEFRGVVEAIAPAEWIVAGQTVVITSTTEIQDVIVVGDFVKVQAFIAADGRLTASEIELDDDDDDDNGNLNENENENENENGNENEDGNANGNENENENENENGNANENDNEDDDENENRNSNTNSNSNDDDHNSNDNDDDDEENGNENGNVNNDDDDEENDNGSNGNGGYDD